MNRRLIAIAVALGLVPLAGWAQTTEEVTYSGTTGGGSRSVVDSHGTPIPFGNEVEIGFFPGSFDVAGNATTGIGSLQTLQANWHEFGSTLFRSFFPDNAPGEFAGDSTKTDASFNGQPIYMWIFETSDNLPPVTTGPNAFSTVLEWGLYRSTLASWAFPSTLAQFNNPVNITSQAIDTRFFGQILAGNLELSPVPEPTALGLFGLGLAVVLGRRFRR